MIAVSVCVCVERGVLWSGVLWSGCCNGVILVLKGPVAECVCVGALIISAPEAVVGI